MMRCVRGSVAFVRAVCGIASVLLCAASVAADVVVPGPDVVTRVVVRVSASAQSTQVGSLTPGQQAELIGTVPNWYEVSLANGQHGFVSKRWTRVVTTGGAPPPPPAASTPAFTIDVLDVGTGLSVLVRGTDFTLLYDGGSNDDMARGPTNRVVAYLQAMAPTLSTIDHLILSHPHQDHVELLPDVFANYTVRDVWDSGAVNNICGYRAFVQAVHDESGVRYHNALQDGGTRAIQFEQKPAGCYGNPAPATTITLPLSSRMDASPVTLGQGATMTVLHADGGSHSSFNENTVVVRLDLGTTRVLLMGDAEAGRRALPSVPPSASSIESVLLDCCVSDLASHVMIVGHHGSKTSSRQAFLNAVSPLVFVVSSGPKKYSTVVLPDSEIITELTGRGQVFRTDVDDTACATNGTKIGATADGEAGGCNAVRVTIPASGGPQVAFFPGSSN